MKKGLVLEGGAMRGMFTAGVIDVMMENDITYDAAIGVSAGAAFGCNYKSHQIGRVIRYNKRFCKDERYCSWKSLLKTGDLYGAKFCYHDLPWVYDPMDAWTFDHNPMKFYMVLTDVETGEPFYKECDVLNDENLEYMRASASMPIVSRPVKLNGHLYLDGGISDSIPLQWMEENGCGKNVVVLTQPKGYFKKPQQGMPLIRLALRKYPKIVERLENRDRDYNNETALVYASEADGKAFVIQPEEDLGIGRMEKDPNELQRVYEEGRKVMTNQIDDLKAFLNASVTK